VSNPFENDAVTYLVLINEEGQYSLWPSTFDVPKGWFTVHDADSRRSCLDYVGKHWTDMRPKSLINQMRNRT